MDENYYYTQDSGLLRAQSKVTNRHRKTFIINIILFAVTFLTTLTGGMLWANKPVEFSNLSFGLTYSILIMIFISSHEFGHYIASRIHGVDATLPFYIPAPVFIMPFGTFGAVIKTRTPISSRKALFDIGVAGPVSGFIVCVIFLIYGFATLPGKEYIYSIHPEYLTYLGGEIPKTGLHFGDTLLFSISKWLFANPNGWIPPMNEVYHYPFLNVGWFGLFVTSLNMLPIGQLDGGHVTYAMFGNKQPKIARIVWWVMFTLGSFGIAGLAYSTFLNGEFTGFWGFIKDAIFPVLDFIHSLVPFIFTFWPGWFFWSLFTRFLIKIPHPYVPEEGKLSRNRMILGWVSLVILVLSFSYNGIWEL